MEALLRELREGPDGIPEYRDTEISGAELTIGSAADQRIQLLGRAVAPEHAVIRKSGVEARAQLPRRAARTRQRRRAQLGASWSSATSSSWPAIS